MLYNEGAFISSKVSELKEMIRSIFHENRCVYGAIRIQKVLERRGFKYSTSYVSRLMKMMGLRSKVRKKYVITTDSNHSFTTFSNVLNREFEVNELGKVWVSDITYIRVGVKWHYLTSMIDLADRQVVGWSISDNMTTATPYYKHGIKPEETEPLDPIFYCTLTEASSMLQISSPKSLKQINMPAKA